MIFGYGQMKILFDKIGDPITPQSITESIIDFGYSYCITVNEIINRSQIGLNQDVFFKNVAQLMANFKMTRGGLFKGVKYLNGIVHDPNSQISSCWLIAGREIIQLRNFLTQLNVRQRKRTLVDI